MKLLKLAGLDENEMNDWHIEFEKTSPDSHQHFLESLGINLDEIKTIRKFSRSDKQSRQEHCNDVNVGA